MQRCASCSPFPSTAMAFYSQELLNSPLFRPFWRASSYAPPLTTDAASAGRFVRRNEALDAAKHIAEGASMLISLVQGKVDAKALAVMFPDSIKDLKAGQFTTGQPVVTLVVSAQLLSGIVRIHHQQGVFLLVDCDKALRALMHGTGPHPTRGILLTPAHGGPSSPAHRKRKVQHGGNLEDDLELPDEAWLLGGVDVIQQLDAGAATAAFAALQPSKTASGSLAGATLGASAVPGRGPFLGRIFVPASLPHEDELFEAPEDLNLPLIDDLADLGPGSQQPAAQQGARPSDSVQVQSFMAVVSEEHDTYGPSSPRATEPDFFPVTPGAPIKHHVTTVQGTYSTLSVGAVAGEEGLEPRALDFEEASLQPLSPGSSGRVQTGAGVVEAAEGVAAGEGLSEPPTTPVKDIERRMPGRKRPARQPAPLLFKRARFSHHQVDDEDSAGLESTEVVRGWLRDRQAIQRPGHMHPQTTPNQYTYTTLRRAHRQPLASLQHLASRAGLLQLADPAALEAPGIGPLQHVSAATFRAGGVAEHLLQHVLLTEERYSPPHAQHAVEHAQHAPQYSSRSSGRTVSADHLQPGDLLGEEVSMLPPEDFDQQFELERVPTSQFELVEEPAVSEPTPERGWAPEEEEEEVTGLPPQGASLAARPLLQRLSKVQALSVAEMQVLGGTTEALAMSLSDRTRKVAAVYAGAFTRSPAGGAGERSSIQQGQAPPAPTLRVSRFLRDASRLDAASWFADSLALMSCGAIKLNQPDGAYEELIVTARPARHEMQDGLPAEAATGTTSA